MAKLFFNQKLFHFFWQNVPSSIHSIYGILYTLYGSECRFFTLYGSECREEEKKGKTWRNEVDTKTVKIATSEIHISILKKNFTILLRTFLHNFLRGITYQKLIFYGRIPLSTFLGFLGKVTSLLLQYIRVKYLLLCLQISDRRVVWHFPISRNRN